MLQTPSYGFNFRFVHVGDPIPSIPPSWLGYAHPGPEYVINSDTSQPVTTADVEVRAYNEADADGDITPWLLENKIMDSWEAHTWYFNAVTICFNGGALSGVGVNNPFKDNPETNPSLQPVPQQQVPESSAENDDAVASSSQGPVAPQDGTEEIEVEAVEGPGGSDAVNAFERLFSMSLS